MNWNFAALLLILAANTAAGNELTAEDRQRIVDLMHTRDWNETRVEEFAAEYGQDAVQLLISIVEGNYAKDVKVRAAGCLGKIGDESAVQPIIDFLSAPMNTPTDLGAEEFTVQFGGSLALGFIGNKEALDYLFERTTRDYWTARLENTQDVPEHALGELILELRSAAITGIGVSGRDYALSLLDQVKNREAAGSVIEKVTDSAVKECRRRKQGLHIQERGQSKVVP